MKNLDTKVIVVDEETGRPMSWDGDQFVFAPMLKLTSTRGSSPTPVKTYKRCDALLLIAMEKTYRSGNGMPLHRCALVIAEHGKC